MCAFFGVSRAAYYAWVKRLDQPDRDQERMTWVLEAHRASRQIYGYRRIHLWLKQRRGIILNHKAVLRLMNKLNIRSKARKRTFRRKNEDLGVLHRYPNLLDRDFAARQPNQKWVTDVTFVRTREGWAYLASIKDLYDGFIVAHALGRENSIGLVTNMLRRACQTEMAPAGLLIHSDQGHQFSSQAYFVLTRDYALAPSMSRRGNCWDNAPMENFFGHLKEECLRHIRKPTFEQLRQIIDDYIRFYNYDRIQLKTRQTPYELRCLSS